MKYLLVIFMAVAMSASASPVACKKLGEFTGQIYTFEGMCPVGYYPA